VRAARRSGRASGSATCGKRATTAFAGFLAAAAARGFHAALESIGLAAVVGHDIDEVFAAISNALTPDGASKDDVAAREAVNDAMEELYDKFVDEGRDFSALEAMTPEDIAAAIESCIQAYVFNRWLGDLGMRIEERAITASEAVQLEREMRDFVRETVHFDMSQVNIMTLDWRGVVGRQFVENVYRDAYSLFGGDA
jgi:hypothetical protein